MKPDTLDGNSLTMPVDDNSQNSARASDHPVGLGIDTLILACDEILRLMEKWKTYHAYSDTCENACNKLRLEMRKHLARPVR